MNNQWSNNLRKRMEDHKEPTPEGLWDNIEQIMKQEEKKAIDNAPLKRTGFTLWNKRIGAAAAIILFLSVIGYHSLRNDRGEALTSLQEFSLEPIEHEPKESVDKSQIEKKLAENQNNQHKTNKKKQESQEVEEPVIKKEYSQENSIGKTEEKPTNSTTEPEKKEPESKRFVTGFEDNYDLGMGSNINTPKSRKTRWETRLYASNISSSFSDKQKGYGSTAFALPPIIGAEEKEDSEDRLLHGIFMKNIQKEVSTDIKHKQPFVIGASFNYKLNEKWSLTSGLTYTKLSSDIRSGSSNNYYNKEQTLHYIGIPLNINYYIWENRNLAIYVSGGGLVEKNVSGDLTSNYVIDDKIESKQKEDISIDPLQWSVNSSLGIQYNFSRRIGIYAEPGASYYFKVNSDIETIYKEKPLSPSLRFGLRISLND